MDLGATQHSIWLQFGALANAPVPLAIALLLFGVLTWWLARARFRTRIDNLKSLADLREAQLEDYREKMGGATSDQAKARMTALETRLFEALSQIAALNPPNLNDQQRRAALAVLDRFRGSRVLITADAKAPEVKRLAEALTATFNGAAWHVETGVVLDVTPAPASGIALFVPDAGRLTGAQLSIAEALRDAGLDFDLMAKALAAEGRHAAEIMLTTRGRV